MRGVGKEEVGATDQTQVGLAVRERRESILAEWTLKDGPH